jgi:hypothetical protein
MSIFRKSILAIIIVIIFIPKINAEDTDLKKSFDEIFFEIEQNIEIYETTKISNLLTKNEVLIEKFNEIFNQMSPETKLYILTQSINKNLNNLNAPIYCKILGNDFESNSNLDTSNNILKNQFNSLLKNIIEKSYNSNNSVNDTAFDLSKIIKNGSQELSNDLILIIIETGLKNNNSRSISTNILYNIYKDSENETNVISSEIEKTLIKSSLKELEYEILVKKNEIKNNVKDDNSNETAIIALSKIITSANSEISNKISNEILLSKNSRKDEVVITLIEQANVLENWKNTENKKIVATRDNFVEKVLPQAVKNINKKKMDRVIKLVQNSEIETSVKIIEAVVDSYVDNNNNFFKLENDFFEKMQDLINASKENDSDFIKSNNTAEIILKSFITDKIPSNLLQNSQLALAYSSIDINKFENMTNISPN